MALTGTYKINNQVDVAGCYIKLRCMNIDLYDRKDVEGNITKMADCKWFIDIYKDETCRDNSTILWSDGGTFELNLAKSAKGYAIQVYEYLKTLDAFSACEDC